MLEKMILCEKYQSDDTSKTDIYFARCDAALLLEQHNQSKGHEYDVHLIGPANFELLQEHDGQHDVFVLVTDGLLRLEGRSHFRKLALLTVLEGIREAYTKWLARWHDWKTPTLLVYDVGEDMMRPSGDIMLTDSPDTDFVAGNLFLMDDDGHIGYLLKEGTCFLSGDGHVWELELNGDKPPTFKPYLPYKLAEVKDIYNWPLPSRPTS